MNSTRAVSRRRHCAPSSTGPSPKHPPLVRCTMIAVPICSHRHPAVRHNSSCATVVQITDDSFHGRGQHIREARAQSEISAIMMHGRQTLSQLSTFFIIGRSQPFRIMICSTIARRVKRPLLFSCHQGPSWTPDVHPNTRLQATEVVLYSTTPAW